MAEEDKEFSNDKKGIELKKASKSTKDDIFELEPFELDDVVDKEKGDIELLMT